MKDTWGNASQVRRLREHRFAAPKGSQPRLAALGSPFQGKGLAWILPPSYGRRCPEGAEVGWGKRYPRHKAFPDGEGYDTRIPFSPYCHFERKREIFFVRGQAKDVRIAASGKHRAPSESEGRCFMQTALRKKTETGNEKEPSAALGMTKRGNASFHSFSTCCGSQPRLAALGSPFQGKGLAWSFPPPYGRRCPEGVEVGWGKRYERQVGKIVSSTPFARAPYPSLARSPFPNGEGNETRIPLSSQCQYKYTHMWKNNTDGQSLPSVGKVAIGASRIGF